MRELSQAYFDLIKNCNLIWKTRLSTVNKLETVFSYNTNRNIYTALLLFIIPLPTDKALIQDPPIFQ